MFDFLKNIFGFGTERKYGFVTGMEYMSFTVKEKIEYHKYNGEKVEHLSYNKSLASMVRRVCTDLLTNKDKESNFKTPKRPSYMTEDYQWELCRSDPEIIWKDKKYKISASMDSFIKALWVSTEEGEEILSVMGDDNIIKWKNEYHRSDVLQMLNELNREAS